MPGQSIPNFFIAGAPKAGTTSLYHHLRQHPDIFMSPVKEPSYFSLEMRPENYAAEYQGYVQQQMDEVRVRLESGMDDPGTGGLVASRKEYLTLFERVDGENAVGEASVCYLWSRTAAKEIAQFNPEAKIVLILRHPAERAFSQYLHYVSAGHVTHCCGEHIARSLKSDGAMGLYHPFLDFGFYGQQMERLLDHIPQQHVRVWLYEDTLAYPAKFYREVLKFLGVDADFVPDMSRRHLQVEVPKAAGVARVLRQRGIWRALRNLTPAAARPMVKKLVYRKRGSLTLSAEDRRFLVNYYRDDVRRLERVIERDLSAWTQ